MILELLEGCLVRAGYEVVTAVDGREALDKWAAHEGRFDLVLLDAMMPRLDGWQTYQRLRALDERVPVLFSSGYSASAFPHDLDGHEAPVLLSKPYELRVLLDAIDTALASTG